MDVHVLLTRANKQLNLWRNIARFYARSAWILLLDIDLLPCTDFRRRILDDNKLLNMLRSNQVALVIPAFEYADKDPTRSPEVFPRDKTASPACSIRWW